MVFLFFFFFQELCVLKFDRDLVQNYEAVSLNSKCTKREHHYFTRATSKRCFATIDILSSIEAPRLSLLLYDAL
jgi:hypothetical protein